MIPTDPSEQCAHARDILLEPQNQGFLAEELQQILAYWLDLEAEVIKHHAAEYVTDGPGFVDQLPSVQLARWIMKEAGCDRGE